jgi:hypothetical protein
LADSIDNQLAIQPTVLETQKSNLSFGQKKSRHQAAIVVQFWNIIAAQRHEIHLFDAEKKDMENS